jgi:hypothetical protein
LHRNISAFYDPILRKQRLGRVDPRDARLVALICGAYAFRLGLPILMKSPPDDTGPYALAAFVSAIVGPVREGGRRCRALAAPMLRLVLHKEPGVCEREVVAPP